MCNYSKPVPGDCHISCVRKLDVEDVKKNPEKYMEFAKAVKRLPEHAGRWPYLFNDGFVCPSCPFKDEKYNKDNAEELDLLGQIMAILR
jgi:hypothetical protein